MPVIDKLTALITWEVDGKALDNYQKQVSGIINTGKKLAQWTSVVAGAFTALGGVVARETSRNVQLAESVGMSADAYLGWEGVLKKVGFEGEKAIDLVEEMNNKIGEMGGLGKMTAVQESFKLLNLNFKELKKLEPEEQFNKIFQAAKDIEDTQVAQSAIDMLMGGEANRILGVVRQYEGTIEEILETHRALNQLTDDGIEGAQMFGNALADITTVGGSLAGEFVGRLTKEMKPMLDRMFKWVVNNRELIAQRMDAVVDKIAAALRWFIMVARGIADVIERFGGLGKVLKALVLMVGLWKGLKLVESILGVLGPLKEAAARTKAFASAMRLLKGGATLALAALIALVVEDLVVFFQGGESFFGDLANKWLPEAETSFLSFMGVYKEGMSEADKEMQKWKFHDFIVTTFENVKAYLSGFFTSLTVAVEDTWMTIVDTISNAIDWVIDKITGAIGAVRNMFSWAFTGNNAISNTVSALVNPEVMKTNPFKATGTRGLTAGTLNTSRTTVTNNSPVNVAPTININAPAGSDANAIATEVGRQINNQMGSAVRNLNTGVKR